MRRRLFRWLLGAGVAVLALTAVLHSPPARQLARARLETLLAERVGIAARIDRLDYSLISLAFSASGVRLAARGHESEPFFTAGRVRVDFARAALAGRLVLDALAVDDGRVAIVRRADGSLNLPGARATGAGPAPDVRIASLTLRDVSLTYTDREDGATVEVPRLSAFLAGRGGSLAGPIAIAGFTRVRTGGRGLSVPDIRTRLVWNGRDLQLDRFTVEILPDVESAAGAPPSPSAPALEAGGAPPRISTASLAVRLERLLDEPALDVSAEGTASADALARWLGAPGAARGDVAWTARSQGRLTALATRWHLASPALSAPPAPPLALRASGALDAARLALESVEATAAGGHIHGHGVWPFEDGAAGRLELAWRDVPLESVLAAIGTRVPARIATRLTGRADTAWIGPSLAKLSARFENRAVPADAAAGRARGSSPLALAGRTTARVADGRFTVEHAHDLGGVHLTGTAAGRYPSDDVLPPPDRVTLAGTFHLEAGDLDETIRTWRDAGLPVPGAIPAIRGGRAVADGRLAGTLADPRLSAHLDVEAADLGRLASLSLSADATLDRRRLALARGQLEQGANRMLVGGTLALPSQALTGRLEAFLADLPPLWRTAGLPEAWVPTGVVNVSATIGGTLAHPRASAQVQAAGVSAAGLRDAAVSADLDVTAARVTVHALELAHPAGHLTGRGHLDLGGRRSFSVDVAASVADAAVLARQLAPDGLPVEGSLALRARASGSIDALEEVGLDATIDHLEGRVAGLPLSLARPARLVALQTTVTIDDLEVRAGHSSLRASGTLTPGGSGLSIDLDGRLEDLAPLSAALGAPAGLELSGPFAGRFVAAGHVASPSIAGSLSLPETVVGLPDVPRATGAIAVKVEDGAVAVDTLRGAWQGATVDAQGFVPLRLLDRWLPDALLEPGGVATPSAWFRARFAGVTPAVLQPWLTADALADVDGRLSGVVEARASRLAVEAVTGTLILDEGRVRLGQVPLEQQRPTRLVLADGRVRVEDWAWSGPGTDLILVGGVTLGGDDIRLDAALDATLDLRVASALIAPAAAAGRATLSLSLAGPIRSPLVDGRVTVREGELRVRDPRLLASDLALDAQLARDRFVIDRLEGTLNGGAVGGAGSGRFVGADLGEIDMRIEARGAAVEFPQGLRSEVDAALRLQQTDPAEGPLLSGTVTVLRGIYREPVSLAGQLFQPRRRAAPAPGRPPAFLGGIRLNVAIATAEDIVVDNNVGRFEAGATLRLLGTLARPSLAGRIGLREGGEVFLGGTTYRLDRGAIDFLNPREIEPTIDITARTQVGEYDIRLQATGTPGQIQADLTSQPPLGRSDIVSLLATGRTIAQGGLTTEVVGEQVLGYLSGDLLSFAGRALGFDSVRLQRGDVAQDLRFDPTLVATQANPTQRLTVSKDVGRQIELVLSHNLKSGDLTWLATYRPRRGLAARVVSNDNGDRSYEFRQEVAVGGRTERGDRTPPAVRLRVSSVTFTGDAQADRRELEDRVTLRRGRRFDFYRWTEDRDRVLAFYHERGYYEARVSATRRPVTSEGGESTYELAYEVRRGPRTSLVVTGAQLPRDVVGRMVEEWQRSVFTGFLVEDYTVLVRTALTGEGWVRARVEVTVEAPPAANGAQPSEKTIRVHVTPGPRYPDRAVAWSGNEAFSSSRLDAALAARGLSAAVWVDPAPALEAVAALYRAEGYLEAAASAGEPVFEEGRARLPIAVREGRRFRLRRVAFEGVHAIDAAAARQALGLGDGEIYRPAAVEPALGRLEARYRQEGFNRVRASVAERVRPEDALVDLDVQVDEGPRQILAAVEVSGAASTHPSVVDRALKLERGKPLDLTSLYEARKRLYETGVFRQVDVEIEPAGEPRPAAEPGVSEQALRVKVALEEWPAWRLRYGFVLTDMEAPSGEGREVGPGVSADLERSNLFGRAATAGLAIRQERRRNAQRAYFSLPRLLALPVTTTIFLGREFNTFTPAGAEALDTELVTLTGEQRVRLGGLAQVSYGYTYGRGRTKTILDVFGQPFPIELAVNYATLFSSVLLDRRDDPLNARRGWFHSTAFEYASTALGSDLRYVKVLAQQNYYRPVGQVVLAWAGRLGLADGFGQEVVRNERFFAGGSTSVRGFGEDALGPVDTFGLPAGGDALVVLNQEARFPLWRRVGGVIFVDAGNVFASPTAIDLGDLEVGAGLGLRVATPFGLLRVDYGVPVSRTSRFTSGRWYFSFGQAF